MTAELLDRIVVSRLIESPPEAYPLPPVQYLIGCYSRAANEARNNRAVAESPELLAVVATCKELIVSYAGLTLQGVVSQVRLPCGRLHARHANPVIHMSYHLRIVTVTAAPRGGDEGHASAS